MKTPSQGNLWIYPCSTQYSGKIAFSFHPSRDILYIQAMQLNTSECYGTSIQANEVRTRYSSQLTSLAILELIFRDALEGNHSELVSLTIKNHPNHITLYLDIRQPYNKYNFRVHLSPLPLAASLHIRYKCDHMLYKSDTIQRELQETKDRLHELQTSMERHTIARLTGIAKIRPLDIESLHEITKCSATSEPCHRFVPLELDIFHRMTNLRILEINRESFDCQQSDITALDFLADCKELREIYIHHAALVDISALATCPLLEVASLHDNADLADVSPLVHCSKLRHLNICKTAVTSTEVLQSKLEIIKDEKK
jgi:hypothetical protein